MNLQKEVVTEMENKLALSLRVKSENQITNLNEISSVRPHHEIDYFSSMCIAISEEVSDYDSTQKYWEKKTSKFFNRKKYKKNCAPDAGSYNDELKIYRLLGALVYPDKLFLSNFKGEIPRSTVIGIKSFKNETLFGEKNYHELAEVTLGSTSLTAKSQNFRLSCERVILLSSAIQANFYHWMVECLPKIEQFKELSVEDSGLKILVNSNVPAFVFDSLALFGIPRDKIVQITGVTAYPEIIFASRLSFSNVTISPLVHDFYKAFSDYLFKNIVSPFDLPKRIYISRENAGTRKVMNEKELSRHLSKLGFEVISSEELSLLEQALIFHNAEFIVGAHGAGLANLVFCKTGTKVLELCHSDFDQGATSYAALCELFSLEYQLQINQAEPSLSHRGGANCNFFADISMIEKIVNEMLDS